MVPLPKYDLERLLRSRIQWWNDRTRNRFDLDTRVRWLYRIPTDEILEQPFMHRSAVVSLHQDKHTRATT